MKTLIYLLITYMFLLTARSSYAQECPDSCVYFVQNVLTPDCDWYDCGVLEIQSSCPFKTFDFTLFNKWGEVIFRSTDPEMKFDSAGYKDGLYVWRLKGEFGNEKEVDKEGNIYILR